MEKSSFVKYHKNHLQFSFFKKLDHCHQPTFSFLVNNDALLDAIDLEYDGLGVGGRVTRLPEPERPQGLADGVRDGADGHHREGGGGGELQHTLTWRNAKHFENELNHSLTH